ncbi:MAG: hypothetical protein Q9190_007896, partial [Brigantiaea leucoxantha]
MAAVDSIRIASSPICTPVVNRSPQQIQDTSVSSSPALPSPSQLLAGVRWCHEGGNKKDSPPDYMVEGFRSAASLLRQGYNTDFSNPTPSDKCLVQKAQDPSLQNCKGRSSEANGSEARTESQGSIKISKIVNENKIAPPQGGVADADTAETKKLPTKKPRARKESDECQTNIKKTRIVKPGTNGRTRESSKPTKNSAGGTAALGKLEGQKSEEDADSGAFVDLCLDEATKRRQRWTPVEDTTKEMPLNETLENLTTYSPNAEHDQVNTLFSDGFGNLLNGFGFVQHAPNAIGGPILSRSSGGEALTKRRKVE